MKCIIRMDFVYLFKIVAGPACRKHQEEENVARGATSHRRSVPIALDSVNRECLASKVLFSFCSIVFYCFSSQNFIQRVRLGLGWRICTCCRLYIWHKLWNPVWAVTAQVLFPQSYTDPESPWGKLDGEKRKKKKNQKRSSEDQLSKSRTMQGDDIMTFVLNYLEY